MKKIKNEITNHEVIKSIIKKLNLNNKQIESGYDLFYRIIDEYNNLEEYEYITDIQVYDNENIIGVSIINKNASKEIKNKKYHLLNDISNINYEINFENPKKKSLKNKVDENVFYWEFPDLYQNNREPLSKWFKKFYLDLRSKKYVQGIYLYGDLGLGKTLFLNALANYLINKNKSITFLTTTNLFEYITKNLDYNKELNYDVINKMKNVDFLIIDDIGIEKANNWFLFSILYPILDHRLKERKTVCFSSNFSINELKKYWSKSKEVDLIKINKLIDKIKALSSEIHLKGKNIRELN